MCGPRSGLGPPSPSLRATEYVEQGGVHRDPSYCPPGPNLRISIPQYVSSAKSIPLIMSAMTTCTLYPSSAPTHAAHAAKDPTRSIGPEKA